MDWKLFSTIVAATLTVYLIMYLVGQMKTYWDSNRESLTNFALFAVCVVLYFTLILLAISFPILFDYLFPAEQFHPLLLRASKIAVALPILLKASDGVITAAVGVYNSRQDYLRLKKVRFLYQLGLATDLFMVGCAFKIVF